MLRKNKIFKLDRASWPAIRNFFIWLIGTFACFILITFFVFLYNDAGREDIVIFLPAVAKQILRSVVGWGLLLLPYFLFRLTQHLRSTWSAQGSQRFVQHFSTLVLLPLIVLFSGFKISQWYTQSEQYDYVWDTSVENPKDTIAHRYKLDGKQRGVHLFSRQSDHDYVISNLTRTNTEWVTLVPFGYMEDYDSAKLGRRDNYGQWNGSDSSFMHIIDDLKAAGFYIMIKPHVWIGNPTAGKWRSDIQHKTEADWLNWAANYRAYTLHYAKMSALLNAEQFCIGTELHQTVKDHQAFWRSLIREVRAIYPGSITYAANWNNEVLDVPFWDQLDYIGIQAYFPLTKKKTPKVRDLVRGWKKHVKTIEGLHLQYDKPILFTEVGYKSTADAGIEPWTWPDHFESYYQKACYKTQAHCYEAMFRTFWEKEWFAGVHFWQWKTGRHRPSKDQRRNDQRKNTNFTPQYKPAENIMTKWFGKLGDF